MSYELIPTSTDPQNSKFEPLGGFYRVRRIIAEAELDFSVSTT
jgi:hypothetical protein